MSYLEQPLAGFLESVASGEPAPGGGSVAAVAVLLAEAGGIFDDRLSRASEFAARRAVEGEG